MQWKKKRKVISTILYWWDAFVYFIFFFKYIFNLNKSFWYAIGSLHAIGKQQKKWKKKKGEEGGEEKIKGTEWWKQLEQGKNYNVQKKKRLIGLYFVSLLKKNNKNRKNFSSMFQLFKDVGNCFKNWYWI